MKDVNKLSHVVWECKYHLVWCPKYRFRILKGEVGRTVRDIIKQLCEWKMVEILEGNVQIDHVHLVLSFPPKYSISEIYSLRNGFRYLYQLFESSQSIKMISLPCIFCSV